MSYSVRRYLMIAKSLLRVPTYLLLILYLFIGLLTGIVIGAAHIDSWSSAIKLGTQFIACAFIIATWYIAGSGLNDFADYEIDKINLKGDKERPLVVGTANKNDLLRVVGVASAIALVLASALSWKHTVLTVALLLLNVAYSLRPIQISRRGGVAPLLLPLGYIVLPFYLGYILYSQSLANQTSLLLMLAYYLHFMGRIILKDYRDVKGDKAHGKITFLLRRGNLAVCAVSAITITISSLLIILALGSHIEIFRYGVLFFLCFGLSTLYELSRTTVWGQQKPLLASFGRAMTGATIITIMTLANAIWHFEPLVQIVFLITIIGVYTWSAQQAYAYNHVSAT